MEHIWSTIKSLFNRVLQTRSAKALVPAVAGAMAVVVLFAALTAAPVAAQGTTPPPCNLQVEGTKFTLPAMTVGQEATLPAVPNATTLCIEAIEGPEALGVNLNGKTPFTAQANGTPLTVDAELKASVVVSSSMNGTVFTAAPLLPDVALVALTDTAYGITIWVGNSRAPASKAVAVDQWQDVRIPGTLGELAAGTTKWFGNGVTVKVTSGMAFTSNGTAVLPEPGKIGEYEFYVDTAAELKLAGTVPGQRFYLEVEANGLVTDAWLQKRVEAQVSPAVAAASTAGAQYVNLGGACFSAATCSAAQAFACVSGAPKLPCTPGDSLSVWRPMRPNPRTHPVH